MDATKNPPLHGSLAFMKLVSLGTLLRAFKLTKKYPIDQNSRTIANKLIFFLSVLFDFADFRGIVRGEVASMGECHKFFTLLVGLLELNHINSYLIFLY
jgi:hypothetical protein